MKDTNRSSELDFAGTSDGEPADDGVVVIVGGGHAGVSTAAGLRAQGWTGRIAVIDEQRGLPYERPQLSKELLKPGASWEPTLLRGDAFYAEKDIELLPNVRVTGIEPANHRMVLSTGETVRYSAAVLATGAAPRQLPVPGAGLPGVLQLKTRADALKVREALESAGRIVIIGAGYIGLEVAAAASQYGCNVTVVETAPRPMNRTTSGEVGAYYQRLHEDHGVKFAFGETVTQLEGTERVTAVITGANERIPVDHVLVGIGVVPNQGLAEGAGIDCNDGILVDSLGRTSAPDVYAVGDVTRFPAFYDGSSQRLESIPNAHEQAERLSAHLCGVTPKPREVPWFWTVQHGQRLQTAGVRMAEDQVVIRGDQDSDQFTAVYIRAGKLAAVDFVGTLKDFRAAKKIIASQSPINPRLIADPGIPLSNGEMRLVKVGTNS